MSVSTLPRDEEEEGLERARNSDFVLLGEKLISNSLYVFLMSIMFSDCSNPRPYRCRANTKPYIYMALTFISPVCMCVQTVLLNEWTQFHVGAVSVHRWNSLKCVQVERECVCYWNNFRSIISGNEHGQVSLHGITGRRCLQIHIPEHCLTPFPFSHWIKCLINC